MKKYIERYTKKIHRRKIYRNMFEVDKQKLKEYKKTIVKQRKYYKKFFFCNIKG